MMVSPTVEEQPRHGHGRHEQCLHRGSAKPSVGRQARSIVHVLSGEGLNLFGGDEQCCRLRESFLLTALLLIEPRDLIVMLGVESLKLPLLAQGEHRLLVGILRCLPAPLHLIWVQAPLPAVSAEFGSVESSGLQYHREFAGSRAALRLFLGSRHHLALQQTGFRQFIEDDQVNADVC